MKLSAKRLFTIINLKTLIVLSLSILSTWLCIKYDLKANFPLTLIATAVIFPIVFSIGGAYKRRETALGKYAGLKGHGIAIYLAARDWHPNPSKEVLDRIRGNLGDLLTSCRILFAGNEREMRENEKAVYNSLSDISLFIKEDLREGGLATGEVSRCNQYLSKMITYFEDIKHIYQYRTPRTLRAFSHVFISILPPLYGPYFAYLSTDYPPHFAYVMPILFAVVLVSLDNIQNHLENPFDQVGEDDIYINVDAYLDRLK